MAAFTSSFVGAPVAVKQAVRAQAPVRAAAVCQADATSSRRAALGFAALSAVLFAAPNARAGLTEDLLASSAANKALNDKKRLATSGANFARTRTVTDGTCAFPNNLVGCENLAETGNVKYLTDDIKLECEGTAAGKICAAKNAGSFPSFMGV